MKTTPAEKEFLDSLLLDYIEEHTTAQRCDVCGAYQEDHRFEDCSVSLAVSIRTNLND